MPPPVDSATVAGELAASRKVRKGTRSCWECKRRKVRCVFRSSADVRCVPCGRRGTSCQSQEHEEVLVTTSTLEERVLRLESLIGTLNEKRVPRDQHDGLPTRGNRDPEAFASPPLGTTAGKTAFSEPAFPCSHIQPPPTLEDGSSIVTAPSGRQNLPAFADPTHISATLHAELPSREDMDILMGNKRAIPFLSFSHHPESMFSAEKDKGEQVPTFIFPSVTDHPVLVARALLQLAFCLEHAASHKITTALSIPTPWKDTALRWHEIASRLVASNDVLIDSVEGLECLLVEGTYLANTGNLRRAWLVFRRAMSLAQMIGVDRVRNPPNMKVLDKRTRFSCLIIWSRLVYMERYLSLLIGMPSSTTGPFLSAENMNDGPPTARIEKAHALICGKIIKRNAMTAGPEAIRLDSVAAIREIDSDLERVANSVPSSWWQIPVLRQEMGIGEWLSAVNHAHCQIIHNSLILMTHLPNLLGDSNISHTLSSKLACMHAGREILHRYSTLRSHLKAVFCCRFVDYCAFKAALALLLVHIDSVRKENLRGILGHQRVSDRALVSTMLEVMDNLYHVSQDLLCQDAVAVTRRLLQFEEQASRDDETFSVRDMESSTDGELTSGDAASFELQIPYFGTVKITKERLRTTPIEWNGEHRRAAVGPTSHISEPLIQGSPLGTTLAESTLSPTLALNTNPTTAPGKDIPYQNKHTNLWASQVLMDQSDCMNPLIDFQNVTLDEIEMDEQPLFFAGADEWAFQGLDSAFFSNVIGSDMQNLTDELPGYPPNRRNSASVLS
ncbi:hypothetical protein Hte_001711 [Hypoxylon texense]